MTRKIRANQNSHTPAISASRALDRLVRLLEKISDLKPLAVDAPSFETWRQDALGVLDEFYGRDSLKFEQFESINFGPIMYYPGQPRSEFARAYASGIQTAEGFLKSRISELEEEIQEPVARALSANSAQANTHKVFIVHGHDHGSKETVARYLSQLNLEPVILHERPDQGRTIIEKFEHHADVACAVVILSPDDVGSSQATPTTQEMRARQNVIFELGCFIGRLGRKRTFALLQKGVTRPSDLDGVLYIPMDDDTWKLRLVGELKAAGMDIDANKVFG